MRMTSTSYAKNVIANTTPKRLATLETARVPAPLVVLVAAGAAPDLVPDPELAAVAGLLVAAAEDDAPVAVAVGNAEYSCALWKVTQFELAGSLAVYGIVEIAPRDSGGWV